MMLAGAAAARQPPSEVIFPDQKVPLNFSHAKHLRKNIACDFCHEKAPNSRLATDNLIPTEELCSTCHTIERDQPEKRDKKVEARFATSCAMCHPGWQAGQAVERVVIPPPNLRFDHKAHVDRGMACQKCHGSLEDVELAGRANFPKMELCLGCHDSRKAKLHASSRCATCHTLRFDGTIETSYASGTLRPSGVLRGDAHTLEFRTDHKRAAQNDEKYCLNCHRQDYCQSCHNGVVKPFDFHPNDYVSSHAVDARRGTPDCNSCHRAQSFCLGCHERLGVVDLRTGVGNSFQPIGAKSFHPAGWADPSATGQPNHHAWQAQRNLKQCVACHRQETCIECHGARDGAGQFGKLSVSPHPVNWRGSDRCQALADRNLRVCLRCHKADDPQLHCR
jgi:hypothetical protein